MLVEVDLRYLFVSAAYLVARWRYPTCESVLQLFEMAVAGLGLAEALKMVAAEAWEKLVLLC